MFFCWYWWFISSRTKLRWKSGWTSCWMDCSRSTKDDESSESQRIWIEAVDLSCWIEPGSCRIQFLDNSIFRHFLRRLKKQLLWHTCEECCRICTVCTSLKVTVPVCHGWLSQLRQGEASQVEGAGCRTNQGDVGQARWVFRWFF